MTDTLTLIPNFILVFPTSDELPLSVRKARYRAALKLVRRVDADLTQGTRHYRNRDGRLLTCLDEVVRAILADELMMEDEPTVWAEAA